MGLKPHEQQMSGNVQTFCFQVTEAVRFLHHSRICHGDLKPGNILLTVPSSIENMGREEMKELLGEPETWAVETRSGDPPAPRGPEYIVCPPQNYWWKKYIAGSIAIIDFAAAFVVGDQPGSGVWPIGYAAPEVMFCGKDLRGCHSDIWSLAATLFEIGTEDSFFGGETMVIKQAVRQMELFLGGLP